MKRNQKKRKIISTIDLKQQFAGLLTDEFENCGFNIILGFESSSKNRICILKFSGCKHVEVCINLGYVGKSVCIEGCSLILKVYYCAFFVAEYIKEIERAKGNIPQSYFEGLTFLNAIDVCKSERAVSVCSPLSHWNKKPERSSCIRPLEVGCAINALNKIRLFALSELNKQERSSVSKLCDSLLLYAGLPEVAYNHAKVPVYALADSFRELADIIERKPTAVREFPILTLAPFDQIKQLTVNDLFLYCVQSDNEFLMGVAIRLIAVLYPSSDIKLSNDTQKKLVDAMNQYIDFSLYYFHELTQSGRCLKKDNLYAVKKVIKSINMYLSLNGYSVIAGNIHSIM